jgi:hypothetical protein
MIGISQKLAWKEELEICRNTEDVGCVIRGTILAMPYVLKGPLSYLHTITRRCKEHTRLN